MQWIFSQNTKTVEPYSHVAHFYDHLMRHVNYVRWADYVMELFSLAQFPDETSTELNHKPRNRCPVKNIFEIACGTGKMMLELSKAGYWVCGADFSAKMARNAKQRLHRSGFNAPVWCGDMRSLGLSVQVDAAICLYDSINYCLSLDEAETALGNVSRIVRNGGVFIFDVCTRHNCSRNFRNYMENDALGDFSYQRYSYFVAEESLQYNEFMITHEGYPELEIHEKHVQRIYSLNEVRSIFDHDLWEEAGCFSGMSRRPGRERAERVHFVLRRK